MREYWDRYIRDGEHFRRVVEYIHRNPVEAGLCGRAEEWRWSSAARWALERGAELGLGGPRGEGKGAELGLGVPRGEREEGAELGLGAPRRERKEGAELGLGGLRGEGKGAELGSDAEG